MQLLELLQALNTLLFLSDTVDLMLELILNLRFQEEHGLSLALCHLPFLIISV